MKLYLARIMAVSAPVLPLPSATGSNIKEVLKQAKLDAVEAGFGRIEIDCMKNGQLVSEFQYEWRNKGDEFIGSRFGDKAHRSGWFNLDSDY